MNRLVTLSFTVMAAILIGSFTVSQPELSAQEEVKAKAKARNKTKAKTKDAVTQRPIQRIFIELDKNENRSLERSEVPKSALKEFDELLELLDTNKDKALEVAEMQASAEKVRKILGEPDRPGAGNPAAANLAGSDPAERFKRMDQNGDGVLTREEFRGQPENFDRMDRNGDGKLSQEEQKMAVAMMRRIKEANKKKTDN